MYLEYIVEDGLRVGVKINMFKNEQEARKKSHPTSDDQAFILSKYQKWHDGSLYSMSFRYDNGKIEYELIDILLSISKYESKINMIFQILPKNIVDGIHPFTSLNKNKQKKGGIPKFVMSQMLESAEHVAFNIIYNDMIDSYKKAKNPMQIHTNVSIAFRNKALRIINGMINNIISDIGDKYSRIKQSRRFNPNRRKLVYDLFYKDIKFEQLTDSCPYLLFYMTDIYMTDNGMQDVNFVNEKLETLSSDILSGKRLKLILDSYGIPRFVSKIHNPQMAWIMYKALQGQGSKIIRGSIENHKGFVPEKNKRKYLRSLVMLRDFINGNGVFYNGDEQKYLENMYEWIGNIIITYYISGSSDGIQMIPKENNNHSSCMILPNDARFFSKLENMKDWIKCCHKANVFEINGNIGLRRREVMEIGCLTARFNKDMSFMTAVRLSNDWHHNIINLTYTIDKDPINFPEPWLPADTFRTQRFRNIDINTNDIRTEDADPIITEYAIIPIETSLDLIEEGKGMHHCVGTYIDTVNNGKSYIYSIRKIDDESRVATLELRKRKSIYSEVEKKIVEIPETISISQLRGICNEAINKDIEIQIQNWISKWDKKQKEEKDNANEGKDCEDEGKGIEENGGGYEEEEINEEGRCDAVGA